MTTSTMEQATEAVKENLKGTKEVLSVRRVFGDSYQLDGATIIPVARVGGGAGGGGGGDEAGEGGFGSGFGMGAQPVGVYEVRESGTNWKPAVDVNRLAKSTEVLAGIIAVCVTLVLWRRQT